MIYCLIDLSHANYASRRNSLNVCCFYDNCLHVVKFKFKIKDSYLSQQILCLYFSFLSYWLFYFCRILSQESLSCTVFVKSVFELTELILVASVENRLYYFHDSF